MYIITSKTRRVISRDPRYIQAVRQETREVLKEVGAEKAVPLQGQDEVKRLADIKANKSKMKESMAETVENNKKAMAIKRKERDAQVQKDVKKRFPEFVEKAKRKQATEAKAK